MLYAWGIQEARRAALEASWLVRAGGLVVYPTDTVYGLGADPLNPWAVLRVYQAKERPLDRPLPVLVSGPEEAEKLVAVTPEARRLMERLWPGPLTLVLEARPGVPRVLHADTGRLGVRMPNHPAALALIEASGGALVGTSANLHRGPSPRTAREALEQLGSRVDAVIDAGPAPGGTPSTVLDLTTRPPRLVRRGPVAREEIERILGGPVE
ncbi:hypothetical protein CF15_07255 [Pyrodictium occultum]|uniref:L-threonylcarbamoyladenylate synthase n=1 Tax=Pyrodictium occultum TaxID=2309 RepID=A0A0V8RXT9_PYROC|nr:hypothetical protein CF15_07255 [Pyrodictium occultum]